MAFLGNKMYEEILWNVSVPRSKLTDGSVYAWDFEFNDEAETPTDDNKTKLAKPKKFKFVKYNVLWMYEKGMFSLKYNMKFKHTLSRTFNQSILIYVIISLTVLIITQIVIQWKKPRESTSSHPQEINELIEEMRHNIHLQNHPEEADQAR